MRRRIAERGKVLAADGEKHATRRLSQRRRRGFHVRHADPTVAGNLFPGRAQYGEARNPGGGRRGEGVRGNDGGKGVGGVHHDIGSIPAEVVREPIRSSESADPGIQRRSHGRARRAGERQHPFKPIVGGDQPGQRGRLGRPAEQEDFQS